MEAPGQLPSLPPPLKSGHESSQVAFNHFKKRVACIRKASSQHINGTEIGFENSSVQCKRPHLNSVFRTG